MSNVSATVVMELRKKSGAGLMDCKKALLETAGDMEAAVDWLRTRGLAAAAKKAGRVASEGLVAMAIAEDRRSAALVEVNAETDFVARNTQFQDFVRQCSSLALEANGDVGSLAALAMPGESATVGDTLTENIARIGENLQLRRTAMLSVPSGIVAGYVHAQASPNMGKIGVIVALESEADAAQVADVGEQLAMHIAATKPEAVDRDSLDPALVDRERAVLSEQARESGKPENIIEKMVEGRLRKYFQEVVLNEQIFVVDGETRVRDLLERMSKDVGASVRISGFVRYALGEGIEKAEVNFAEEVAAAVSGS